jgi:hypothetical protein
MDRSGPDLGSASKACKVLSCKQPVKTREANTEAEAAEGEKEGEGEEEGEGEGGEIQLT